MEKELIKQYAHTWRTFENIVKDFDDDSWVKTGRGAINPSKMALHILLATQNYIDYKVPFDFPSGKPFNPDEWGIELDDLPTQDDILAFAKETIVKTEEWLNKIEFSAKNEDFPWAGETKLGVVLFLLRHTVFHMGELSSLLNESKDGKVDDHFAGTVKA